MIKYPIVIRSIVLRSMLSHTRALNKVNPGYFP